MKTELSPKQLEALERNQFRPGHSGNPGGKSATRMLRQELRAQLAEVPPGQEKSVAQQLAAKLIELAMKCRRTH